MIDVGQLFWVVAILVVVILIYGVFRFFFRHLLHFFFRGCGFILLIAAVLYVLHAFKFF